jgi:hypothetical protein
MLTLSQLLTQEIILEERRLLQLLDMLIIEFLSPSFDKIHPVQT